MVGGTIGGYWAMGRLKTHARPAITMTMDTTQAKMGWSTKKRDMRCPPDAVCRNPGLLGLGRGPFGIGLRLDEERRHVLQPGLHFGARSYPLQTVHDDPVGCHQDFDLLEYPLPVGAGLGHLAETHDLAQAVVHIAYVDGAVLDLVLVVHDQDKSLPLVGADGRVGDQESQVRRADRHANAAKHAGEEAAFVIGKDCPDANGAGVWVDLV